MSDKPKTKRAPKAKCPMCKQPAVAEFRPFCSKRCADADLGRWLTGGYVVPGRDGEALGQIQDDDD